MPDPQNRLNAAVTKDKIMTTKLALSAIALLIAAPAFANASQLESSANVEVGAYTQSQLVAIASAEKETEAERLRKFYAQVNASGVSRADFSSEFSGLTRHSHPNDRR